MKPIKLKIKGLNSFIEEQEIDFLKLTDRGLFGIFGPTGSGKSSILDGITLALYGEVARKSSNFININCNKANIHYEFQISGKTNKIYSVDREFKRDKKSGNPVSGKCKICDITESEPVILAEKVKDVTNKCREIIGLSLEDFTRTVVLPQGKFSEFLKLEGRGRREMLERLFNLKKYGDDLQIKLSNEINNARNEANVLQGELNGYEEVSIEGLNKKKEDLKELKDNYEGEIKKFNDIDKKYNEGKEVFMLHNELNSYEEKLNNLMEKENSIKIKKDKIDNYTRSSKIVPVIKEYNKTLNILKVSKEKEPVLKGELENTKVNKEKIEDNYKKYQYEINSKVPELKIKVKDIEEAILIKNKLDKIINEIKKCENLKLSLENELKEKEEKRKSISEDIEKLRTSMKHKEKEIEDKNISNEEKENIQKGYILEGNIRDLNERLKNINLKINDLNNKSKDLLKELNDTKGILKDKEDKLNKLNINYNEVISKRISQENLLKMQEQLSSVKEKYNKYNKLLENININKSLLEEYIKQKEDLKNNIEILEKEVTDLKEKKKHRELFIACEKLRKELETGKPCPVCGSIHHEEKNIKNINENEDVISINEKLEIKENELKEFKAKSDMLSLNINSKNELIKDDENSIKELGEDFKKYTVKSLEENFKKEVNASKENEKTKDILEKEINILKEEISEINNKLIKNKAVIDEGNKMILSLNSEKDELSSKLSLIEKEIINLKNITNVLNFTDKYKEISINEKYLEKLTAALKSERETFDNLNNEFNTLNVNISTLSERITNGSNIIEQKLNEKKEKILEIKKKAGNIIDLEESRDEINNKIKEIENKFKILEESKEDITNKYNKLNESYITLVSSINEYINRESHEKNNINNLLLKEGFKSIEECMKYDLSEDEYNEINKEINEFNSSLFKIKGAIESIKVKINNRYISKEDYEKLNKDRDELSTKIKELNEEIIKKQEDVLKTEERIKELNILIDKKDKLSHKIAILNDLDKLFRGKKFIEFVAIDRLKYISKEASKRLKDITNGNYGLEVDENSKFIIRDYKNGGAKRDASTLSGGEIFLASLSLALALSSEIQLKGTAPLELFFLDEGFGTLDDNLLDIVMSSLERIHNDKLKVGIISHVESIKNRVPVKLIITPAESGVCGSKVKIERS